jgi:hypothetical protein
VLGATVGADEHVHALGHGVVPEIVYGVPPKYATPSMTLLPASTVLTCPRTVVPGAPFAARVAVHVIVKAPAGMLELLVTVSM